MAVATEGPSVAALAAAAPAAPPFGVFLGTKAYALAHLCIWLFHAVCVAYFIAAGMLYRALATTQLAGMLELYALTVPRASFKAIGIAHFVVAALYARYLVASLRGLVPRRVRRSKAVHAFSQHFSGIHPGPSTRLTRALTERATSVLNRTRLWKALTYTYGVVLSPSGFFGVESNHFEILFLVREITETILQTNQAYQMSRLLPRAKLNRVYVALLAINCWSTPFFYRFGGHNRALQRALSLLCDVALDFISAVGVPVWLALDYLSDYDTRREDFPLRFWYDDSWIVRLMNDVPLMLLGNWVGAFSRLLFSVSLVTTFDDIRAVLKRKNSGVAPTSSHPAPPPSKPKTASRSRARLVYWAHIAMVLYGDAIIAVQLFAELRPTPDACVLVVRPWLESQPACALLEINCLMNPILTGSQSDFDKIMGPIDELSLEHVVFRHCPQIEVTSTLQGFTNLIGLKVYNSTISSWGVDAAITRSLHPNLRFLYLVHTRFPNGTLPPGLVSREFPSTLRDIEISGSNLNGLPDDLHERWPQKLTLYLEFGALQTFPHVLTKLKPRLLTLCGNPMTQLPAEALLMPTTYSIGLTGSQLEAFPDTGVNPDDIYTRWIYAEATNIARIPDWMDEAFLERSYLNMGGSPFCVDVMLNESSPEREQLLAERPYLELYVDCNELDPLLWPFYPQYLEVRDDEQALLGDVY